ncbi:MAG TPA: hypothetical protein VJK48_05235, partial [Chlamydiales bacterium]|nr:hypothetical protein [Chlamydiales bacterium]
MSLFDMERFVETITRYLEFDQPFRIVRNEKGLAWEQIYDGDFKKDLESVEVFSSYLLEYGRAFDYRALSEKEF